MDVRGYVSRFLIAKGIVKTADTFERFDYSNILNTKKLKAIYKRYRLWKFFKNTPFDIKNQIKKFNQIYDYLCANFGYYPKKSSNFWNLKFIKEPEISNYYVGNIFEHDKTYDFVSAYSCLEYFKHDELFKKIFNLLNEDGIFVFIVNYWWWPVNSSSIIGYFPYASQRLERDDFIKYLKEFHENDESKDMLTRYDYFADGIPQKPTLSQYISSAERQGLSLIGYNRLMPSVSTHPKTSLTPNSLDRCIDFQLKEVLENIHSFRKDATIEDLKTAHVMAVFKKKKNKRTLSEEVEELKKKGFGYYTKL